MKVGFLGAGNMARAMAQGLLDNKTCSPNELYCLSGSGSSAGRLATDLGIVLANTRSDLFTQSDIIILAFKPQHLETVTKEEAASANNKLVISVLAGRTLESLRTTFPDAANCVRVMPNTPSKIGQGVSTYCFQEEPTNKHQEQVTSLLTALGTAHPVKEEQLHIATAINGCGPAVFFQFIDFLAQAAQSRGLPKDLAIQLATETGLGSLALMQASDKSPEELVREVVSPNGVTHALLESLKGQNWDQVLDTAIEDAVKRSIELSGS
ncbi:pyrroline-5-carboxylate reductase [Puniceicoccaceae bacterium K14]|nr:pyrroline-5-carboxylate reductase [Puniceicoccaceae bacterium K14]